MENQNEKELQSQETQEEYDIYTPNYNKTSNQGVVADDFHGEAPLLSNDEAKNFEDKFGIKINYGYNAQETQTALKIFQKHTIYKKNYIYTAILFIIFAMYAVDLFTSPTKFNMFLSVMCLAVVGFIWYFPLNHVKQMTKIIGASEYHEDNVITFYDDGIMVGEGDSSAVYYYDAKEKRDLLRVWETKEILVVGYGKERVFIVPKRCCGDELDSIKSMLKYGLGDRYSING